MRKHLKLPKWYSPTQVRRDIAWLLCCTILGTQTNIIQASAELGSLLEKQMSEWSDGVRHQESLFVNMSFRSHSDRSCRSCLFCLVIHSNTHVDCAKCPVLVFLCSPVDSYSTLPVPPSACVLRSVFHLFHSAAFS